MDKKICVIGGGRWGKNHIRTLAGLGCLAAVVEADAARLKEYTELYPGIKGYADMDEAIACGYDGYTVALPAELHYPAGRKLLEKGLNVMLEKPMTLTAAQSAELVELAQRTGARLMVGHVLLFHPAYSSQTFESWFKKNAMASQDNYKKHVSFFHGCYINYNFPQLGKDMVSVLNAIGYGVHLLEKEKCCGVALISNGLINQARKQAEANLRSVRKSIFEDKRPVIGASSTCIFTMRDEYPHLLGIDNADVRDSIELATRFIFRLLEEGNVKLKFRDDVKMKIAYHTPCHMEKLGWAYYSIALLRSIPNINLIVLNSQCCGIAGTYGFKKENYETSQGIGASLFRQIEEVAADFVATDCETCKWQIEMSTPAKVKHPISILAEALDLEATRKLNSDK